MGDSPNTLLLVLHTMLVESYFNRSRCGDSEMVSITRQQASSFAKEIANDFNPLHDIHAKRFCVPGDLLFALVLANYGISPQMRFAFKGMVTDEVSLVLPADGPTLSLHGDNQKLYLDVEAAGQRCHDQALIDSLTKSYVTFSGRTFPHVLIPLMHEKDVIINPDRPMVMYERMLIDLNHLDFEDIQLELDEGKTQLEVSGKRGSVCLAFNLLEGDQLIGRGEKHMLLSGLRPFEQEIADRIIADYNLSKSAHHPSDDAPCDADKHAASGTA